MSAALHLAQPEHLEQITTLVAAFHAEEGITQDDETRRAALAPLLEGSPYGAIYIIGPIRAPIGYIIVTFTWSVEFGGLDGLLDELYIRPPVRGRGIASEVLIQLPKALAEAGVRMLHLEVTHDNETAKRLYLRSGFKPNDKYLHMSRKL